MKRRRKRVKIVEKKLGREHAVAQYINDGTIQLDPRQRNRSFLDSAIHEALHAACDEMSETKVIKTARIITDVLWRLNYRRVRQ